MKLDYKKTLKVGLAFAIILTFWTVYDYVIPLLLENTFGLSNSMRGLVMGLDNLLSLFLLPFFGKLSDKTVSKYGKRTPFIVIGTLLTIILMVFVPVSSNKQLKQAMNLRQEITNTFESDYVYIDHEGVSFNAKEMYTYLYEKGKENSDFCDHTYLKNNNINSLDDYLEIALNGKTEDGKLTKEYNNFVKTGINNYASTQVNQKITKNNLGTLVVYMVILLFVLIAMATFRSPAIALMPDMTPKPLRSQANALISLMGGIGGAIAFLIYTIVFTINETAYIMVYAIDALAMLLLLIAFLKLVNEKKLVLECEELCKEYGITNDNEDEDLIPPDHPELRLSDPLTIKKLKRARFVSFMLILSSIFMWFIGYNAVTSNISIYVTKTLNLDAGLGGLITGISLGISAVAFIPVGYLATKIGRKKTVIIGYLLSIISCILIFFFVSHPSSYAAVLFTVFYLISGFGLIIANVNTLPMVVELSDKDSVGKFTGFYYSATMSAQAITPFIVGIIMDKMGNKFLFLYSVAGVAVAAILMAFVKHGDSKPLPKKKTMLSSNED